METAALLGVRSDFSGFLFGERRRLGYRRTKHEIEGLFLANGYTVLRPGLVMGPGGFRRQRAALLRNGPGLFRCWTAASSRLPAISLEISWPRPALYWKKIAAALSISSTNLCQPIARFVSDIRKGKATFLLPIPVGLAMGLASAAQWLRKPIPVTPEQIRALTGNQISPWRSDLSVLIRAGKAAAGCRFPPQC